MGFVGPGGADLAHQLSPFRRHRSALLISAEPVDHRLDVGAIPFERHEDRVPHVRRGLRGDAVLEYRSEEHTSELQSRENLVCRLLLEKKKKRKNNKTKH